ncbi:MAG: galactose-1-phosphate uridylyltransferase [Desulfuromonadales bacterium]|nr:galactose-1-phosphate uridylyltransferase [Desulfuromonadales bacterium]
MSQFRRDPLKGSWVISENFRPRQPREFIVERQQVSMTLCPFCPGQEAKTPPEVFAVRPPNSAANASDWQVRVVPNKFPILRIEGELNPQRDGLLHSMQGIGAHEVIIETPDHDRDMASLSVAELSAVLGAYRARLLDLRRDKRFRYLQIFKNHGVEAGAPLPHSHSQLMALPITPPVLRSELNACREHFMLKGRCLACDLIAQEMADGRRVVLNDGRFLVIAPYASCLPFELRLFPLQHCHDFALQNDQELQACAAILQSTLRRLSGLLRDPPYNFILHTAPPIHHNPERPDQWGTLSQDYHWHIELAPRLNQIAGFEWGSGFFINPLPPEDAARFLRETDPTLSF